MVEFSNVKPGDILYDVQRVKMGNTTMRRTAVYEVRVIEVLDNHAMVSWNSNKPQKYRAYDFTRLRRTPPKSK